MNTNRKPRTGGIGAGQELDGCPQNTPLKPACQDLTPLSVIIRRIFIKSLVSQPFTAKRSLKVDGLLTLAEFLEEVNHDWN